MPPVAVWGFADGDDVVDLMATDPADNWLHVGRAAFRCASSACWLGRWACPRAGTRRLEREVAGGGAAASRLPHRLGARGGAAAAQTGPTDSREFGRGA